MTKLSISLLKSALVFVVIASWIFLGWPQIFHLPPEIEKAEAAWFDSNWSYRKKITINASQVPNTNQTNFPVLINRTDLDWRDTANGGKVGQSDGGDILFTAADEVTKLDHEIEKYIPSTGELVAWVEVPTVSASVDTEIYVYYGNGAAANQWDIAGTWETGFKGVWHLHNDFLDSTQYNNNGSNNGSTDATGKIGDGQNFAGSQWVQAPHSSSLNITGTQITVSAWVRLSQLLGDDAGVVLKSSDSPYEIHLGVESSETGNFRIDAGGSGYCRINTASLNVGTWYYLTGTYDGATTRIYLNGNQAATCSSQSGNINANTQPVVIGRRAIGDLRWFYGDIDEPRMTEAARSADWILTEFNNQNSPASFYGVGPEETQGAANPFSFAFR
jgi:MSHA biogenesis protein MshQ